MKAIVVDHLIKHFGKTKAVDGISFDVSEGEIFGFLGPNGAGKTTTIRCMMDFLRPQEGSIELLGNDSHRDEVLLKKRIGYVSGSVKLYDHWTGNMHIDYFCKLHDGCDRADELLHRFDFNANVKARQLSSGNRQKLALILALMHRPDLLILDEPTTGLDPILQNIVYDILFEEQKRGATVFMSSHNLAEVERVCERVGIIRDGKMVAVDSIHHLRDKRLYNVRVMFHNKPAIEQLLSHGATMEEEFTRGYRFSVKGDVNAFLANVLEFHPDDLEVSRASLENIFLEFYE